MHCAWKCRTSSNIAQTPILIAMYGKGIFKWDKQTQQCILMQLLVFTFSCRGRGLVHCIIRRFQEHAYLHSLKLCFERVRILHVHRNRGIYTIFISNLFGLCASTMNMIPVCLEKSHEDLGFKSAQTSH